MFLHLKYFLLRFCSPSSSPFVGHFGYFHKDTIDPSETPSPTLPNQFASSKTNIVFNQMQLGLQVKISLQLKLIRPIMSLGVSWVTTGCMAERWQPPATLQAGRSGSCEGLFRRRGPRRSGLKYLLTPSTLSAEKSYLTEQQREKRKILALAVLNFTVVYTVECTK